MIKKEFDRRLREGTLAVTLAGISNVGKTHWSSKLATESGFGHICCDDLIETEVGGVLRELGYNGGIADMAKWMGQPYDIRFSKNQRTYLDLEVATMNTIIRELEQGVQKKNILIDTTGSVVHTGADICRKLRQLTLVVYLEATPSMQEEMFELYIKEPKPVVWGHIYKSEAGESPKEALARCYPRLLAYRSRLYEKMAHVTIQRQASLGIKDADGFLEAIRSRLPD